MIADLIEELPQDTWRATNPFSTDMQTCHAVLLRRGSTRAEMTVALDNWLKTEQPCLFGRMEVPMPEKGFVHGRLLDGRSGGEHGRLRRNLRRCW